jgi:hypothetical protein
VTDLATEPSWTRDVPPEETSYLKEMLTHQWSLYGALSSLAAGAVLAIPFGFGLGAVPVLAFAAAEAVAALFVPDSARFRHRVDERKRAQRRDRVLAHLKQEIHGRVELDHPNWDAWRRMGDRLASLREIARQRRMPLEARDLERLEDARADYMGLWLAHLVIDERERSVDDRELRARVRELDARLAEDPPAAERRQLEKARQDFERILERHQQMRSREAAVDAAMLNIADTFEEVYQGVITNPTSSDATRRLQEAVDRLKIEEELEQAFHREIGEVIESPRRPAPARAARSTLAAGGERRK